MSLYLYWIGLDWIGLKVDVRVRGDWGLGSAQSANLYAVFHVRALKWPHHIIAVVPIPCWLRNN